MPSILLVMKHYELDVHNARTLARIARETSCESPVLQARGATAGGDERRLRGIPVVGARGVPGAIPGTSPHAVRSER